MARKPGTKSGDLFIDDSGQLRITGKSAEQKAHERNRVECLGMTFQSEDARRDYFLETLRGKLADGEFRHTPGFPEGNDDDILRMSDPPWYTACPNPFLGDFIKTYGKPFDPSVPYDRDPFAVDVSVGKTDALYQAHGYHTKVPHLAIVPSILHYTQPGDIVLDGFCGSGMTGVAAQTCEAASAEYRRTVEADFLQAGRSPPIWGERRVVLNDLSPAATLIAAGYNLPFSVDRFEASADRILRELQAELGWMYETLHVDGTTLGRVNYTVWSQVFSCPECGTEIDFSANAVDEESQAVNSDFHCAKCNAELDKDRLQRVFTTRIDPATGHPWQRVLFRPWRINYTVGKKRFDKTPDDHDRATLARIESLRLPTDIPTDEFPIARMYHGSRLAPKGFTRIHHLFLPRALHAVAALWRRACSEQDPALRRSLLFFAEQAILTMSLQNRFQPQGFKQVNKYLPGVYYVPSQHCEVSPWYAIEARGERLASTFKKFRPRYGAAAVSTGQCGMLGLPNSCIDYIFTDPPFGANIFYADLNYVIESWHRVKTASDQEAIVDQHKGKGIPEYQELMRLSFREYFRVLKPGRWMTVVFSNSSNAIWRAIQESLGVAGFVVADVRTLDKQLGSYRQVTSTAVKQDLVISAYKPTERLNHEFELGRSSPAAAWSFVAEHLRHVPVFVSRGTSADVVAERTAQVLMDRVIAFHVQRGIAVPLSGAEFLTGIAQRFPERDGMYFLPEQVAEYDRKRVSVAELQQLELFIVDESSALQWLRRELGRKPQTFQELQPAFMREMHSWSKHERTFELRQLLEENFLCFEAGDAVPSQIHSYLSTNFRELRKLEKGAPALLAKAVGRWFVPDPSRQVDLERIRERSLLKEFALYRDAKARRLKQFRLEAVRAGFRDAYETGDYGTIVAVAGRLPEAVILEDEKLLMYFDVAQMRLGGVNEH